MTAHTIVTAILPFLFIAAGVFAIVCSIKEYPFFMNHRKAQTMIRILGRTGAKVFYITLGVAIMMIGIVFVINGIPVDEVVIP